MMDILENQQVQRRPKPSFHRSARYGKPYGSSLISQIRQEPARIRRRYDHENRRSGSPFIDDGNGACGPAHARPASEKWAGDGGYERRAATPAKKSSGFSFQFPSLATMAVIAGIILFAMLALNWPGFTAPASPSVRLPADEQVEEKLAWFAGISPLYHQPAENAEDVEIPLDLMETFEWKPYTVKRGESVYTIARNFGVSMDAIITSNNIRNARRLSAGTELRIPNMDGILYTVKRGDTLSEISASMNVPLDVILDVNDIRTNNIKSDQIIFIPGAQMPAAELKMALGELFKYPVAGRLTDSYGYRINPFTNTRQFHAALDLAAPSGTVVKAAMDGKVSKTGFNANYGNFIILSHGGGYETLYAHLSVIGVKQGNSVLQGNKIGEVGSTGRSTGSHLHFMIYKNGRPVNPLDLLF